VIKLLINVSMLGTPNRPGVVPNTLQRLYDLIEVQPKNSINVKVSYLEVYNEVLRDLLTSEDTNIDIREEPGSGIQLSGMKEIIANSKGEIMTMLKLGSRNRMKEPTLANEVSSRSHAIFLMTVEITTNEGGKKEV
jgi:kinesin family member 18/19